VPHITQGTIIRASVLDPDGKNLKVRPLVVLTATREIAADEPFIAVAITTSVRGAADEVRLPWSSDGRSRTKLTKPCVAKCSWAVNLTLADVVEVIGHLPSDPLDQIAEIMRSKDV